jgi:hypothetical protein
MDSGVAETRGISAGAENLAVEPESCGESLPLRWKAVCRGGVPTVRQNGESCGGNLTVR